MGQAAKVAIGSKWKWNNDERVWVVIERMPFGRIFLKQIDRAVTSEVQQRAMLAHATQVA